MSQVGRCHLKCIECREFLDSYGACPNRDCCEWRGLAEDDYFLPIIQHGYKVVRLVKQ